MGDSLLTADLGSPLPAVSNAAALGAGPNLASRVNVSAIPKNPENNLSIARRQREQGENPGRDPNAQNPYSSAGGLNQIVNPTWLDLMKKYKPELVQGKTTEEILAMKSNGDLNNEMAAQYDQDNAKVLASNGIAPTPNFINALYRAGPGDGLKLIQAARSDPGAMVKDVAPALATPGNNGAGNLTVGQFLMNPYQKGPGAQENDTPQQMFTISKGNQVLTEMLDDTRQAKARVAQIDKDYKPLEYPKAPEPPQTDPLKSFGSIAGLFAVIAAGFSKTPAIAAMNGLAGAMDAAKKSDWQTYQAQYDQFKTQSELALKAHEQHSRDLNEALDVMSKNAAAGTAMLQALAALSHDDDMHKHLQLGDYIAIGQLNDQRNAQARDWSLNQPVFEATATLTAAMHNRDAAQKSGDPAAIKQADDLVSQAESQLAGVKRSLAGGAGVAGLSNPVAVEIDGKPGMAIYNKQNRSWETPEGAPIRGNVVPAKEVRDAQKATDNAPISDEGAAFAAGRVLAGDERATVGMARSNANITKVTNEIVKQAKAQNMNPGDLAVKIAQFQGTVAAERTLGTRTVNMEVPANEVEYMAPLALEASEKVDRTQFPDLNAIMLAGERRTGNTDVVQFGLAANSLIYTYAKFLNPTGIPTDADKAKASEILSTAWTKGQFKAAIDQIKREIASGQTAVQKTRGELAGGLTSQTGGPSGAAKTFSTEADVEAAAAAGTIKPGDKVIVGGRAATWH